MTVHETLADVAAVTTALGLVAAPFGVYSALKSLRTEAKAVRLQSIINTNEFWDKVGTAVNEEVELSELTIASIQRTYLLMGESDIRSVTDGAPMASLSAKVPFVVAALLPFGNADRDKAPLDEPDYVRDLRRRTLAVGYVRTVLADETLSPWLTGTDREQVTRDLEKVDARMEAWVGRMNEVAELYQEDLLDRRLFVSKRSVTLVQQLFAAEPYILWRNSTVPGRWGLRPLGLGSEARLYHWGSSLQHAALRLRNDPPGYEASGQYPGFSRALGWIIGPGHANAARSDRSRADRRLTRSLGAGFSDQTKGMQNDLIRSLPINAESGLGAGAFEWVETTLDPSPTEIKSHLRALRGRP